jgi:hypothetical protein
MEELPGKMPALPAQTVLGFVGEGSSPTYSSSSQFGHMRGPSSNGRASWQDARTASTDCAGFCW